MKSFARDGDRAGRLRRAGRSGSGDTADFAWSDFDATDATDATVVEASDTGGTDAGGPDTSVILTPRRLSPWSDRITQASSLSEPRR